MPRVVPSQVIPVIEARFPHLLGEATQQGGPFYVERAFISGLVTLIDRIPDELYQVPAADFSELVVSIEVLRSLAREQGLGRNLVPNEIRALKRLYAVLNACPDDVPASATSDPTFITDADLRTDLRRDLSEVNRALHNGEWKGATVLAGSIIEALLLWVLQNRKTPTDIQNAATALHRTINLTTRPLEHWDLWELIEYASATKLIGPSTRAAADQARDFRNLIHPGKAQRLAKRCNRATAMLGVGAVEAVIAELG